MLTKFSNDFGVEALNYIYKSSYNFNYYKLNELASLFRKSLII